MLILSEHPANFHQTVKWSYPWYSHNGSEMFSVSWHKEHAAFQLWNGAHIPNPTGLIEGTGKNGRNIKIKSLMITMFGMQSITQLLIVLVL